MSNERYYCPETNCEIVPSGLNGTYHVCRTCKMEVTEKLRLQKIEEAKHPKKHKSKVGHLRELAFEGIDQENLDEMLLDINHQQLDDELQKAFEEMLRQSNLASSLPKSCAGKVEWLMDCIDNGLLTTEKAIKLLDLPND